MNTVNIIGRLTKDAELRKTNSEKAVCSFCIAVDAGQDKTYFIDCVAWNKRAEAIAKYFKKGSKIGISGELSSRTWQDSEGHNRKAVEVIVLAFDFCDSKQGNENNYSDANTMAQDANFEGNNALPFDC